MTPQQAADVLQIERPWTPLLIKRAYRLRSKEAHPDHGGSDNAFKRVAEARRVLDAYLEGGLPRDVDVDVDVDAGLDSDPIDGEDDLQVGAWFEVLGVRVDGHRVEGSFGAQLVELQEECADQYGQKIRSQYLIGVYPEFSVRMSGDLVELVLQIDGEASVLVRKICQRSYDKNGNVSAFWIDPLLEPVFRDEYLYEHAWWGRLDD